MISCESVFQFNVTPSALKGEQRESIAVSGRVEVNGRWRLVPVAAED